MSIDIMNEVWKHAPVDQGTLLVLLALADAAEDRTRTCYPGVEGLAAKSRLSERQVQYCLQRLREVGVITVQRNASPVKTNLYRISEVAQWANVRDAIIAPHGVRPETQSATDRYEVDCVSDTQLVAPKPSVTSEEPSDLFGSIEPHSDACEIKIEKSDRFAEFWTAFPKKAGKPAAQKAWQKAIKKTDPEKIIAAAKVYANSETVQRGFIKHAQGWLNDERFNDPDLQPPPPKAATVQRWYPGGVVR